VTITRPFYLGRFEVTQAQWVSQTGTNPSFFSGSNGYANANDRPVEQVSWFEVQNFVAATGLRLPTEAEWEMACRAGTQTSFYNGASDDRTVVDLAWFGSCCSGNSGAETHSVGGKSPNALGFYDMLGNVWEWCADWGCGYSSAAQIDPLCRGGGGDYRIIRGGSWYDTTDYGLTSSGREILQPWISGKYWGFRVARNP